MKGSEYNKQKSLVQPLDIVIESIEIPGMRQRPAAAGALGGGPHTHTPHAGAPAEGPRNMETVPRCGTPLALSPVSQSCATHEPPLTTVVRRLLHHVRIAWIAVHRCIVHGIAFTQREI